jgi:acetyl esterase/lipase
MPDRPNPFDPAVIAEETAAFNAWLAAELAAVPPVNKVPPALTRKARAEGRGLFPDCCPLEGSDWASIPGPPGGPGRVRISLPDGAAPRGTYLHIHGGGWTLGAPDQYDIHNQRIAGTTGCRVASVQYRLAPEHPWPAQVAGAVLNYGIYDLRMTPSMANWGERYLILSTPVTDWFCENLLPGGAEYPARRGEPAVSPLMADLGGLAPALFQVGTLDPLIDDSLFMAQRWQAAGNRAELAVYPGGVHAFDMFDLAIAHDSRARQDAFMIACLQQWAIT